MHIGLGTFLTGIARGVAAITYLLRATFTRANTGALANGTVLNSAALGVEEGSLTVVDTSTGTVEVLSNQLKVVGNGTLDVTGVYSGTHTKTLGKTFLSSLNKASNTGNTVVGIGGSSITLANGLYEFVTALSGYNLLARTKNATENPVVGLYALSTAYQTAIVLGGYDVNGVPYKSGDTKANFTYGCAYFIKGGAFTNWTLLWRTILDNTANVVARINEADPSTTFDNLRIPDSDLSAVLQPTVLDTFTDTNGTALTAHTSDVAVNPWVVGNGTWDIQSNELRLATSSGAPGENGIIKECGISDCVIEVVYKSGSAPGIRFRYVDESNFWIVYTAATSFVIYEYTAASWVLRASTAITRATNDKITLILDGSSITAFRNGGNKLSYTSSVRQTATKHGVHANNTAPQTLDNFAVFNRTSATYESQFGGV